jgi:hypothetical protein
VLRFDPKTKHIDTIGPDLGLGEFKWIGAIDKLTVTLSIFVLAKCKEPDSF